MSNLVAAAQIVATALETLASQTSGAVKTQDLADECGMAKEDVKKIVDALMCTGEVDFVGVRGKHGGLERRSVNEARNAGKAERDAQAATNRAKKAVKTLRECGAAVPVELLRAAGEEVPTEATGTEG